MPVDSLVSGPTLTHRSQLLERLIDFEIEAGAEFIVEMHPEGYALSEEWDWLPKSAREPESGIILINAEVKPAAPQPRMALLPPFPIVISLSALPKTAHWSRRRLAAVM